MMYRVSVVRPVGCNVDSVVDTEESVFCYVGYVTDNYKSGESVVCNVNSAIDNDSFDEPFYECSYVSLDVFL